jgi:hypothetical protein
MNRRAIILGAALMTCSLAACSSAAKTTSATTISPAASTTTALAGTTPGSASTSSTTSTTVSTGPPVAGQPTATSRSDLGFVAGYQETAVEANGLQLLQTYEPADATPGTQVHCPAVVASVGTAFVCQVDANASATAASSLEEPLKVDATIPLKLEFAIITPSNFVCSAHAAWVVQAMTQAGLPCTNPPTTTQGQGNGQ